MSIDTCIYIGPYIEWFVPIVEVEVDYCKDKVNCPNSDDYEYCPRCGICQADRFKKEERVEINVCENELIDHVLHNVYSNYSIEIKGKKYSICRYTPNLYRTGYRKNVFTDNANSEESEFEFNKEKIKESIKWFEETYKEEIEKLTKEYKTQGSIKYGYLKYFM